MEPTIGTAIFKRCCLIFKHQRKRISQIKDSTMRVKTCNLIGAKLDHAVAMAEGLTVMAGVAPRNKRSQVLYPRAPRYTPCPFFSTDWSLGGPIIEKQEITLEPGYSWRASKLIDIAGGDTDTVIMYGDTPLIAAMRCRVAAKLGNEVEIPEALI